MRISDWSSDVCSSDLGDRRTGRDDEVVVARRGGVARADIGIGQGQIMPLAPATVGGRQHALAIVIFRTGDDMEPVVEKMQADGAAEFVAFAVAAAGDAALDLALDPAEILVENAVDPTGHRARTVGRPGDRKNA